MSIDDFHLRVATIQQQLIEEYVMVKGHDPSPYRLQVMRGQAIATAAVHYEDAEE